MALYMNMARNKRSTNVLLHFIFWVLIFLYFSWGFSAGINFGASVKNIMVYMPGFIFLVYMLIYVLIPRFLITKKYWQFISILILLLGICTLYAEVAQAFVRGGVFNGTSMRQGRGVLPFIHVAGIAISINLANHWYRQKERTLEALQQKTAAELELLKSQVHPHFLFNTLNNLYSFSLDGSPAVPEIILKLSGLLRFMIYESSAQLITVTKEIALLTEYIALEQLRYGKRLDVSITVKGDETGKRVPPLLMLPLVENAFKHGTSNQTDQCWISFYLNIAPEGLRFKLVNSVDADQKSSEGAQGVGLNNVRRRLELLYPGEYLFTAETAKDVFIVNLEFPWDRSAANDNEVRVDSNLNQLAV